MKIRNSLGLSFDFLENGSVESIEVDQVRINLKRETPFSRSGTHLYLRKRNTLIEFQALMGPASSSRFKFGEDVYLAEGSWAGLTYTCSLELSHKSCCWQWRVRIKNNTDEAVDLDLVFSQDAGLKPVGAGMINEYYVSQYLERRILMDETYGAVAFCRQNMKEPTGHPWFMLACCNGAASGSTDGMQFYGKSYRETGTPEALSAKWMGGEYAGESSVFALQEKPFVLSPGDTHESVFLAAYLPDHPAATSEEDLKRLPGLIKELEENVPLPVLSPWANPNQDKSLFNTSSFLTAADLNEDELKIFFGVDWRHCETFAGQIQSFFSKENHHVVLRAKEMLADRPHAHIMQAEAGFAPDENIVSTTAFAFGIFNSHLSQGNTNFNTLLSVCANPFNLETASGQRVYVEIEGRHFLLGIPSAFEMGLNHCRWIYKYGQFCFQLRTWTSKTAPQVNMDFKVISGKDVSLVITHHFESTNSWTIFSGGKPGEYVALPEQGSMMGSRFPQAQYRIRLNSFSGGYKAGNTDFQGSSLFVVEVLPTSDFCMSFIGEVCRPAEAVNIDNADEQWLSDCRDAQFAWRELCQNLTLKNGNDDLAAIREIMPWYGMNALTHFLTPYGLEQFSGAAWGTRDIAQGPFDMLLSFGKYEEARRVLLTIFSNQNTDGGWPQWWMFDSYSDIRADTAHGDVSYWCLIALCNYVKVTGDTEILDERLPYYHAKGVIREEITRLNEHIDRLIDMIVHSFINGTALVPFGGGDWNDSLQPVSKELAQRMISSWTVEMNYQAFSQCTKVYELSGNKDKADRLKTICEQIRADFNKYLIKDDVVAGYGLVEKDGRISLLLHPGDSITNIRYSILPMSRGVISSLFTKEQALHHLDLVERHLKGPDGARLMDRPLRYKGGIQEIFQRAESSTFFGREIGLMYVHEHIRYAESLAITGKAGAFLKALRQANPVGYRLIVPCSDLRQSNCYYSSSDIIFKNRYEADEQYDQIKAGKIILKGGWRVYSSGPGIYIGLIVTRLLGLRIEFGNVIIDPVIPHSMDGVSASMNFLGHPLTFHYSVGVNGVGPEAITVNGETVKFSREENKYRQGGAVIPAVGLLKLLNMQENHMDILLS